MLSATLKVHFGMTQEYNGQIFEIIRQMTVEKKAAAVKKFDH